jgi:hypothetical protein
LAARAAGAAGGNTEGYDVSLASRPNVNQRVLDAQRGTECLMLTWVEAAACGAGGGLIVEAVVTFGRLHAWQQARHAARATADQLPRLGNFVDPLADSLAALFRVVLGGVAAWLLHYEVTGVYAAVTVGASAPALLAQVGMATAAADARHAGPTGEKPSGAASHTGPPGLPPAREEASS